MTLSKIASFAAVPVVAAGMMTVLSATPASAASAGYNMKNSSSVLYTRACLDYSKSACALHVVKPGQYIPNSTALYLMPGYGWKACAVKGGANTTCVSGSTYKKVGKGYNWRVSAA